MRGLKEVAGTSHTQPNTTMSQSQNLSGQNVDPLDAEPDVRLDLLRAGLSEFARHGYGGARLERIAEAAGCAKRMIYYYFGNKKEAYLAVLEWAYGGIRASEQQLNLEALPPCEALRALARQSFLYHERNADFTRLVLQENLQLGGMLEQVAGVEKLRDAALKPLAAILERGAELGDFRPGLLAADVHYLISALSSFRIDHAHTWKSVLEIDLLADPARGRHLDLLLDQLDRMTRATDR